MVPIIDLANDSFYAKHAFCARAPIDSAAGQVILAWLHAQGIEHRAKGVTETNGERSLLLVIPDAGHAARFRLQYRTLSYGEAARIFRNKADEMERLERDGPLA